MESTYNFMFEYMDLINEEKPFIVTYRSEPIRGITLELMGINPNYNFSKNTDNLVKAFEDLGGYEIR